jgi:hypothetical protein
MRLVYHGLAIFEDRERRTRHAPAAMSKLAASRPDLSIGGWSRLDDAP